MKDTSYPALEPKPALNRNQQMHAANQQTKPMAGRQMLDGPNCQPPSQIHEVEREYSGLMDETERLSSVVTELLGRLRPVICDIPSPGGAIKVDAECGCYSEIGNGIRAASDRLRVDVARLRDLIETLAV